MWPSSRLVKDNHRKDQGVIHNLVFMNSSGPTDCGRPTSCPTTYRRSESLKAHRWNERDIQITKTGGT